LPTHNTQTPTSVDQTSNTCSCYTLFPSSHGLQLFLLHDPPIRPRKTTIKGGFKTNFKRGMEGERGVVNPSYDLQVSFTNTPQAIHEMGFVQFEENQVLSFLAPSAQSQSSQLSQSLNVDGGGGGDTAAATAAVTTTITATTTTSGSVATIGFNHNDLASRTSWNNEQVLFSLLLYMSISIYSYKL